MALKAKSPTRTKKISCMNNVAEKTAKLRIERIFSKNRERGRSRNLSRNRQWMLYA
jgi:hypothetical protein